MFHTLLFTVKPRYKDTEIVPKTKDIPRYPYNEVWHTAKLIPAGPADVSLYRGYPYIEYPCSEVSLYCAFY
jgi:hypothetical protein